MSPFGALALLLLFRGIFAGQMPSPPAQTSPAAGLAREKQVEDLFVAVRAGDLVRTKAILDAGVDVNSRDALGGTALLDAVWIGSSDLARLLLARGADVNAVHRESGATALKYAVLTSRPALVQLLLSAGADVHHTFPDGQTVVHLASSRSSAIVLSILLLPHYGNTGAKDMQVVDGNGNTPLDEAVLHDQLQSVMFLLSHGADVGWARPADGRTALHEASAKGFADLVPCLLKAGASLTQKDRSGQTPLDLALAYKNVSVVSELLREETISGSQSAAGQAMEAASLKGQTEIVQILLRGGFDINHPKPSGSTYLHDAALKNQVRVARLLVAAGARLDARNRSGGMPLHDAALGGSVDVISFLLDSGAAIDARDSESQATPLMLAASLDRLPAVELLLRRGADPELTDSSGHTALDRARMCEDPALLRAFRVKTPHSP